MQPRFRWWNPGLPQMLGTAVFLLYADAVLIVLEGGLNAAVASTFVALSVIAALGIVNERRSGYSIGLSLAILRLYPFIEEFARFQRIGSVIGLAIAIAKFCLFVLPESREHQRAHFAP